MTQIVRRRGVCLVIAAPSGGGKSTIAAALRAVEPDLANSVSVTTRKPRPGELDGVHYHFRDQAIFDAMVADNELLEWAHVFGRSYGTPRRPVEEALDSGRDVIFDIDWQGYRQLRTALPGDVVGIFILPPSLDVLDQRLQRRGGDDPQEIRKRMAAARSEISHWREFDHVIINSHIEEAVADARAVLRAARLAVHRQPGLVDLVNHLNEE